MEYINDPELEHYLDRLNEMETEWVDNEYYKLFDETIITFGKHKGKVLCDVPHNYLLWLQKTNKLKDDRLKRCFSLKLAIINYRSQFAEYCSHI